MPRKLRIEYLGAMYHVRVAPWRPAGEDFLDDVDPQDFIKMLADASQKTNWQAQAYCLVPTHCHLALETPEANLVAGMAAPEHGPSWCGWTGCWASTESRRTRRRAGRSSSRGWIDGGWKRQIRRRSRCCGEAGAWAARASGGSCC